MIVTALQIKNFKCLKSVKVTPDHAIIVVTGSNAQGKSSVLDAIESAIGGKQAAPERPIRNGEDQAEVRVTLGDLVVIRKWSKGNDSRLIVENADGSRPRSPQTLLSALYARVAVDPGEFVRWEPRKQVEVLRKVAGIDEDLAALDADAEKLRAERQDVTRAVKSDEGALNNFPTEEELAGVPDKAPEMFSLVAQYREAVNEKNENDKLRAGLERERAALATKMAAVQAADEAIRAAQAKYQKLGDDLAAATEAVSETEAVVASLVDPDTDAMHARIAEATGIAAKCIEKRARREVYDRWLQNREHAASLTSQIEAIRAEKEARLSEATFPVPGLDVRGDEVRLNGVPLDQASSAQKIRLGLAVGAALNPTLRVALIRDGSLLDDAAMAAVEEWSRENNWQTWCERVGGPESANGIVIEAGEVIADRQGGKVKGYEDTKRQAAELF